MLALAGTATAVTAGAVAVAIVATSHKSTPVASPSPSISVTASASPTTSASVSVPPGVVLSPTVAPGQPSRIPFEGKANQRISMEVGGVPKGGVEARVLAPDDTQVTAQAINPPGEFIDTMTLPVTGTYTFLFSPFEKETGAITVKVFDVPDDPAPALTIGGDPVTLTTTTPGQNAQPTFQADGDQRIRLSLTDTSIGEAVVLSIFAPDATRIVSEFLTAPKDILDLVLLPAAGEYRILVDPEKEDVGSTTITLIDVPADPTPRVTIGGKPVTITTTTAGQNAQPTFVAKGGQRIHVNISRSTLGDGVLFSVFAPNGDRITSEFLTAPDDFVDRIDLPASGTYRILIDPEGNDVGSATIRLINVPPDPRPILTVDGGSVTFATTAPGQNAQPTFDASGQGSVVISLARMTYEDGVFVSVFAADGSRIASTFLKSPQSDTDPIDLPAAGTYRILIDPDQEITGQALISVHSQSVP
jgi:hypothetical protein